ncbi:hypothetical protein [Bradyrhizobium sp. McL0615]|uniref:hypothetical protein n=1 Tax=Bradyrhizobium sp. McL0615 TaxID=3415673 RepID=UPI003CF8A714
MKAQLLIEQYANDLRAIIEKLRKLDLDQALRAATLMVASSKGSESDLLEEPFVLSVAHLEMPQLARCPDFASSDIPAVPLAQPIAARLEQPLVQSASAHRTDGLC